MVGGQMERTVEPTTIGHPMQGMVSAFIEVQDDPVGGPLQAKPSWRGRDRERGRLDLSESWWRKRRLL